MSQITAHMLTLVTVTHPSKSAAHEISMAPSLTNQGEIAVWALEANTSNCVAGRLFPTEDDAKVYANQLWSWL